MVDFFTQMWPPHLLNMDTVHQTITMLSMQPPCTATPQNRHRHRRHRHKSMSHCNPKIQETCCINSLMLSYPSRTSGGCIHFIMTTFLRCTGPCC